MNIMLLMYRIFREGGIVEPPQKAQIDTLSDGENLGYTNGLSKVEVSLRGHRLKIKSLSGRPVVVKLDPLLGNNAICEQTLGGFLKYPKTVTTLRRNVVIESQGGEHRLVLHRNTPLIRR